MGGNERRAPKRWTEEEDKILWEETRKQSRTGNVKDWNRIAAKLPNRSNKDCRKRWVNTLSGSLKKGAWGEDEDERLIAAVNTHGPKWTLVANEVALRSPDRKRPLPPSGAVYHADLECCYIECAKRWQHNLDPKLEHRGWTDEEDELLLASVEKYGREWKVIQERSYNTRSRNDLKNRYSILSRRRNSSAAQGARQQQQQQQANSPSISESPSITTPGNEREEDLNLGIVSEDLLMQDPEAGDCGKDPAYIWSDDVVDYNWLNLTESGPDSLSSLDATTSTIADLATAFPSTEGMSLSGLESTDPFYGLTIPDAAVQQPPWIDLVAGGEALYGGLALGPYTPPTTEISTPAATPQSQDYGAQTNEIAREDARGRIPSVVDGYDWDASHHHRM